MNHGRTLRPQNPDRLEEIDYALALHPLQNDAQRHEHARPAHTAAVKKKKKRLTTVQIYIKYVSIFDRNVYLGRRLTPDERTTNIIIYISVTQTFLMNIFWGSEFEGKRFHFSSQRFLNTNIEFGTIKFYFEIFVFPF